VEFERVVELTLEIVVSVKVMWRVGDVIQGGGPGVLKNGGEEYGSEGEAPTVKWRDASFHT